MKISLHSGSFRISPNGLNSKLCNHSWNVLGPSREGRAVTRGLQQEEEWLKPAWSCGRAEAPFTQAKAAWHPLHSCCYSVVRGHLCYYRTSQGQILSENPLKNKLDSRSKGTRIGTSQKHLPVSVKDWMSYVRSTLRFSEFSVFLNTNPITHIVRNSSLEKKSHKTSIT